MTASTCRPPLRTRDLHESLDLSIASKNTEKNRSKLKCLVSRGILVAAVDRTTVGTPWTGVSLTRWTSWPVFWEADEGRHA
ncbi:hypothetical protein ABZT47_35725 [Sphaerisporangium sp. NPDC005289]|uniref:hypothetical protein n=1 Tax=Sphaerisporangium sp. NPDC005289 TaxID=3155247 RepID=UPI0033A6E683